MDKIFKIFQAFQDKFSLNMACGLWHIVDDK